MAKYERPADAVDLTDEELAAYEAESARSYAEMIGANLPDGERARRAQEAAARLPALTERTWPKPS